MLVAIKGQVFNSELEPISILFKSNEADFIQDSESINLKSSIYNNFPGADESVVLRNVQAIRNSIVPVVIPSTGNIEDLPVEMRAIFENQIKTLTTPEVQKKGKRAKK
jgi:hypothetical protein